MNKKLNGSKKQKSAQIIVTRRKDEKNGLEKLISVALGVLGNYST